MPSTISLNENVLKMANQALLLTHFKNVEELIASIIEEKLKELAQKKNDPIYKARGILRGKNGGTSLFIQDKRDEIDKEYSV